MYVLHRSANRNEQGQGSQLDLWQIIHDLPLNDAALLLCQEARLQRPLAAQVTPQEVKIHNALSQSPRTAPAYW